MRLLFSVALAGAASLVLFGCGGEGPVAPLAHGDGPVVMGSELFVLEAGTAGWSGTLTFEYRNQTDRTISLLNCRGNFGLRLEKWMGQEWVLGWAPVLQLCLSPPIEISPGESHEHELHVFGGFPDGNVYPKFFVDEISGHYRLVITSGYWDYDPDGPEWGELVPLEERVSRPFRLWAR